MDVILLTHVHPDHSNGITSDDGKALFPNAEIILHENEIEFWFDDAAMAAATPRARTRYFEAARFRLAPYKGRIRTFPEGEVLPGIFGIPSPGHTPGHSAYRISSGAEELLIWGDVVHYPELQIPRPEITVLYDNDQPLAAASRIAMFELAIRDKLFDWRHASTLSRLRTHDTRERQLQATHRALGLHPLMPLATRRVDVSLITQFLL